MPVILQVNYMPGAKQRNASTEARVDSARSIAQLPGLRWKVWIADPEAGRRGGIYLFDDLASARAWGTQVEQRLAAGGGTDLQIRYFDVDEAPSAVTRAPLG